MAFSGTGGAAADDRRGPMSSSRQSIFEPVIGLSLFQFMFVRRVRVGSSLFSTVQPSISLPMKAAVRQARRVVLESWLGQTAGTVVSVILFVRWLLTRHGTRENYEP